MTPEELHREMARTAHTSPTHPCYDCGTLVPTKSYMACPLCLRIVCERCWNYAHAPCRNRVGASHKE
jgi:hypothetical protein